MKHLAIWSMLLVLGALPLAAQEATKDGPTEAAKEEAKVVQEKVGRSGTGLQPLVEIHVGYDLVTKADDAIEFGGSTETNVFGKQYLGLAAGVDYLNTATEREITGGAIPKGSFSDLSVSGDLRLKPFQIKAVAPYLGVGLGLHFRSNDYEADANAIEDVKRATSNIADIYDGVGICAQGSVGVLVDGTESGAWGVSGELRSVKGADVDRTAMRIGLFVRL
jgi:hypothetical protein